MQVFGDLCVVSYWIDTLVLKTEGNTYATLLHHPFLFKGKPTHAQEVARRISGAIAGEVATCQDMPSTHHKLLSLALHYLPLASRFPLPHFTLAVLFALSFRLPFSRQIYCLLVLPCAFYFLASLLAKSLLLWIHLKCSTWIIFDPYVLMLKPQLA